MKKFGFSKSKYVSFCKCGKLLWLQTHKPQCAEEVDNAQVLTDGIIVGDLAKSYFGKFVETTAAFDEPNIPQMLERTQQFVLDGAENICEAAFSFDGCYCAVDILHKQNDGYAICEVKSTTGVDPSYIWDIAYQKWVLEKCGIKVAGTYLLHINNKYVRQGEIAVRQMFTKVDVAEQVAAHIDNVELDVATARQMLAEAEPVLKISKNCKGCPFWKYCTGIAGDSVFDLYGIHFATACKHFNNGIVTLLDVAGSGIALNEKQLRQVQHAVTECNTLVDRKGIGAFLGKLKYPLYFLDFEGFTTAIPLYDGTSPFQQIPFQYSLHIVQREGAILQHKEYLAETGIDPRRQLAEKLVQDIPTHGSVIVYNKVYESGRLRDMAKTFPDLANDLLRIEDDIVDLLDVFRGGYVYNRAMGGSFSIKNVLPALFPNDPELDYHNLDEVHNGTEASETFLKMGDMPPEQQQKTRQNMLHYCGLDTYAMVKIWQWLECNNK